MEGLFLILVVLLGLNILLIYLIIAGRGGQMPKIIELMQKDNQKERQSLLETFGRQQLLMHSRLDSTGKLLADVSKNLGEIGEIGRSMKSVQEFLLSPKLRGNLGEQVLNDLLSQILPPANYKVQYTFKSGTKVDAAIFTSSGIIPIDAKFPMEIFSQMIEAESEDLKNSYARQFEKGMKDHIDAIAQKYINPSEGTIDYAIMYLPSESVYYEVVNRPNLYNYAQSQQVIPSSPATTYAYLKSIMVGLEGQKIEAKSRIIISLFKSIKKEYDQVEGEVRLLSKHLSNAANVSNQLTISIGRLGQKIDTTKQIDQGGDDDKPSLPN